jgi:hypothetical protein
MHAPREPHLNLIKWILRYVRGTLDLGLQLHSPRPSRRTPTRTRQAALTLAAPPLVTVSTLATTWYPGPLNARLLCLAPVPRPCTVLWLTL